MYQKNGTTNKRNIPLGNMDVRQVQQKQNNFWKPRNSLNQFSVTHDVKMKQKPESSIIMVPCLNCEELIQFDLIDQHSRKCVSVSKKVKDVGKSSSQFDEIDFKILKLKESFIQQIEQLKKNQIMQNGFTQQNEEKFKYLCRACEIAEVVCYIKNNTINDQRKLKDIDQELRILIESYKGSIGLSLYIERLHSLILQKLQLFQNARVSFVHKNYTSEKQNRSNSNSNISGGRASQDHLKNLISEKKYECDKMKYMADMYQQKTQQQQQKMNNYMKIPQNYYQGRQQNMSNSKSPTQLHPNQFFGQGNATVISKFSGTQKSQLDHKSDLLSQISSSQLDSEQMIGDDQRMMFNSQDQSDQLQRIFYSKCLNQKMKLQSNSAAQKLPVSLLYKESLKLKIDQSQWDEFIQQALNNPYQYLDMNKINQHENQRLVKNNLREKTYDQQFKQKLHNL